MKKWWIEWTKTRENLCCEWQDDQSNEPRTVGNDSYVSENAIFRGNVVIGNNCMIGNGVILRGNVVIEDNVRIGAGVEIKDSIIKENTMIGPLCFIGDSLIEKGAYLGALVRTSNHRLDKNNIQSWNGEAFEDTGCEKLGAWIQENAHLGIGVVILPGRIVSKNSLFEPNIIIKKNHPTGHYRLVQNLIQV